MTPVSSLPFRLFHSSCLDYIHSFMVPQLVLMSQFYLLTLVVKHTDKTVSYVQRVYFSGLSDKDKGDRGINLKMGVGYFSIVQPNLQLCCVPPGHCHVVAPLALIRLRSLVFLSAMSVS